jgi:hypothetical protein
MAIIFIMDPFSSKFNKRDFRFQIKKLSFNYSVRNKFNPSPFSGSFISSPLRTTTMFILGMTINVWFPAPEPKKRSLGARGHTPSKLLYQASPHAGEGCFSSRGGTGVPAYLITCFTRSGLISCFPSQLHY